MEVVLDAVERERAREMMRTASLPPSLPPSIVPYADVRQVWPSVYRRGEEPRLWVGGSFVRSFVLSEEEEEEEVEPVITVEGTFLFRGRWAGSPQTHGKKEGRDGPGWTDAKS